ncbi:MAG: VOC family protein [Alphaproteobacteria bacterium]|nr:VOC family protein [Alphaproteobacteria bacterium]
MKRALRTGLAALALALAMTAAPALAQDSGIFVRSVRIGATDVEAVAKFYEKAFGMHEVRRLVFPALTEIIVNSGATKEDAAKNPHAPIVVMTRPKDLQVGVMAAVILNVSDMEKAIASVEAAGGTLFRKPAKLANGTEYAFVKDPEGNQVELLVSP